MPIYEFQCDTCGHRFEELCRMGEDGSSLECPVCRGHALKRRPSVFSARSESGGESKSLGASGCGPT